MEKHIDFKKDGVQYYVKKRDEDEYPIVTMVGKEVFLHLSEKMQFLINKKLNEAKPASVTGV